MRKELMTLFLIVTALCLHACSQDLSSRAGDVVFSANSAETEDQAAELAEAYASLAGDWYIAGDPLAASVTISADGAFTAYAPAHGSARTSGTMRAENGILTLTAEDGTPFSTLRMPAGAHGTLVPTGDASYHLARAGKTADPDCIFLPISDYKIRLSNFEALDAVQPLSDPLRTLREDSRYCKAGDFSVLTGYQPERYRSAADIRQALNQYLSGKALKQYRHLTDGDDPYYKDGADGLYVRATPENRGFHFTDKAPVFSDFDFDSCKVTLELFADNGIPNARYPITLSLQAESTGNVLAPTAWKIADFTTGAA